MTSRHGLRDFCYICLYLSYRIEFFFVSLGFQVTEFIPTIANCVTLMRDLESEGHVMDYVTLVISACIRPTAMIFSLFRKVFQVTEFIPTIANCVTLTRDLESEGHVMDYVTLVISACIRPTAMISSLFRKVFRSRNSFQLLPIARP